MRRQHFAWTFLTLSVVLLIYGIYSLLYSAVHDEDMPILGLVFLIAGVVLSIVYITLLVISYIQKNKKPVVVENVVVEEKVEEPVVEAKVEEKPVTEKEVGHVDTYIPKGYVNRSRYDRDDDYGSTIYVKLVGYGPVLRVTGSEVLDMRSNTYYRIQGNMINKDGSGPAFEISGNKIRVAFSSYLYEISGDNVNKVFGGYYASFNGAYLQTYDLSQKYEITGSLNIKQKLAVVALLFGTY